MRRAVLSVAQDHHLWPVRAAVLARAGYAVTPATNLRDALAAMNLYPYSAVVIGHSMPEYAQQLLADHAGRLRKLPVLILYNSSPLHGTPADRQLHNLDGPEALLAALRELIDADTLPPRIPVKSCGLESEPGSRHA